MIQRRSWLAKGLAGIALAQLLAGCGEAAENAASSAPDSAVVDTADILPPDTEAALSSRLSKYWDGTGNAVVVASVTSLDGKTIDAYAFDLFNEWGIGDSKDNRGLLVLVAPGDRRVRIEVGCGLEEVITNAVAKDVIDKDMIPEFKAGDLERGTLAGVDALIERLGDTKTPGKPVSPICKANLEKAA